MTRDYIDFQDRRTPIGFLITFRCYGTWLHGDERGSFDRYHRIYGTAGLPTSQFRREHDRELMKQPPVVTPFNESHRLSPLWLGGCA